MSVINESGLYAVILRSDKPNAQKFRRWVTSEVLPTIRKHGVYATTRSAETILRCVEDVLREAPRSRRDRAQDVDL